MLNLTGTVNGFDFADPSGFSVVGNDRFQLPPDLVDFLSVSAGSAEVAFETNGYRLTNVRMFWIEGSTTPNDFLQSDLLPDTLPVGLTGRLALDFELTADPNVNATVFFDDLTISQSP